ncbi:ROK family protein [Bacteroides sp.]|uniref:ROK family protein n=1 Tax=Bacteroides sp. TaxID=29523 RepID=UPI002623D9A0|nr:ROK family protein [Bacteroides sp.]
MSTKHIIAVDLGGTFTKVGLLRDGELIDYIKMSSRTDLDMSASLPEIESAINFLIHSNNVKRILGIGIAFPGLVDNRKSLIISTNEKYDDGVNLDLDRWADDNWGVPFYIDNDARLATIGEWQYGSGKGYGSVVMMTIGTGIGTGVIMEGKVMYGKHFQAGSLGGHFVVDYKGRLCSCGNKGCVEALSSSFFLHKIIKEHASISPDFKAVSHNYDFKEIFQLAESGDKDALLIRNECIAIWGAAVINFIHAYDPEVVILGGGIMNSHKVIVPYIEERVQKYAWTPSGKVPVVVSSLGDYAALYGLEYCLKNKVRDEIYC